MVIVYTVPMFEFLRRNKTDYYELVKPLEKVRHSVCALLRVHPGSVKKKKGQVVEREFQLAFVGTAWCVVTNKYVVTAYHVLNKGKPRDRSDRFYVFTVPNNEHKAYHFPVTGFHMEDQPRDMAILEVGPPSEVAQSIVSAPVTFRQLRDGSRVLTYGFPAPEIHGAQVNESGEFVGGGQFFLKGHANEGIIAGQYQIDDSHVFEFNVGWHHGESGGPVFCLEPVAVFGVMQQYRNIRSPHGIVAGPHVARSLSSIESILKDVGATVV